MRNGDTPDSALPPISDAIVGRTRESRRLRSLLRSTRLLTLVGPGGVGKTRLARELLRHHDDSRVRIARLDTVPVGGSPASVVAAALGSATPEGLADAIGTDKLLVLLDNCEHVIEPCARLVDALLRRCPGLRFLTASREALRVPGEVIFRMGPLGVPESGADNRKALRSESVRLFVERARRTPCPEEVGTVAEICRKSDGLPLAIELAARQVGSRSLAHILNEMTDRPAVVTDPGPADRHRNLAATIEWSYRLLTLAEQAVFRRLSVLPGGFDLEAAGAVCVGGGVEPDAVVRLVCALEAKSQVIRTAGDTDTARFRQLRCVRAYAQEQLVAAGELEATQKRAVDWLGRRAEALCETLFFGGSALSRLWPDRDNLAAAIGYAAAQDGDRHVLLAVALARLWWQRQHATTARRVLTAVLSPVRRSRYRGEALAWSALAAGAQADYAEALAMAEQAVLIERGHRRPIGLARALNALGFVRTCRGELVAAATAYRECLDAIRATDQPLEVATCQHCLAWTLLMAGQPAEAEHLLAEAVPVYEALAPAYARVAVSNTVGALRLYQRDFDAARDAFVSVLHATGPDDHIASYALDGLAMVAAERGDARRALSLLTAGAAIRQRCGVVVSPAWQRWVDVASGSAKALLDKDKAAAAVATGQRLDGDRLLAYALEDVLRSADRTDDGTLTCRERQIAVLVADGLTDQEIAERLGLSVRTVRTHLTSIHNRLDLRSRIQLAVWTTKQAPPAHDRAAATASGS
jgi:non-specific serine/threonine protein kinase